MVVKKEDSLSKDEEKKKGRGRPKGSKDSKPRKSKAAAKKKSAKKKKVVKKTSPHKAVPEKKLDESPILEAPLENVLKEPLVEKPVMLSEIVSDEAKKAMPLEMKIEPASPPADEEPQSWSSATINGDRDLSIPPDVLLKSRNHPHSEVEDILEDPMMDKGEMPERAHSSEFVRPPVKTNLYRKLAIGFTVPVILLVLIVVYVTYARATVTIYPQRDTVDNYEGRVITIREEPEGTDEVAGEIHEVTVGGEKTGAASESVETEGVAKGFVTLVNDTSGAYTLVATTRLLSVDNILFRLADQVRIPANGELTTEVYADIAGKSGDITPTEFTIPGLRADTQKVVYARSKDGMTGGLASRGVVSQDDIDAVETTLYNELIEEAIAELGSRTEGAWTGQEFEIDTMNRFVNATAGEEVDSIVVRLTLRVRSVSYDRSGALEVVVEDLKRGLTSDRELVSVDGDDAQIDVERADVDELKATLRIRLTGESSVALGSPLFDAEKLKGLNLEAVSLYFEGIAGVERVDVRFRPFWLKRMPQLADHIEFKFEK